MNIRENWGQILEVLKRSKRANRFFSIATVDAEGNPHVTPIGHVFFRNDMTGFYFDEYSEAMPKNFESNRNVCLMAVNSSASYWLTSLLMGKFTSAPAVRLKGTVGDVRDATQEEIDLLNKSISATKFLKGHRLLWSHLTRVRDIDFYDFSPVKYPVMCDNLWAE